MGHLFVLQSFLQPHFSRSRKLSATSVMSQNGWTISTLQKMDGSSFTTPLNIHENCNLDGNFYGFTDNSLTGELSYTFTGDGYFSIKFSNCGENGLIKAYYDDELVGKFFLWVSSFTFVFAGFIL